MLSFFGIGKNPLPATVGDAVDEWRSTVGWTLHEGTTKDTNLPCSVFRFSKKSPDNARTAECAANCLAFTKKLRHPHFLSYVDSVDLEGEICLVTEAVSPLDQ